MTRKELIDRVVEGSEAVGTARPQPEDGCGDGRGGRADGRLQAGAFSQAGFVILEWFGLAGSAARPKGVWRDTRLGGAERPQGVRRRFQARGLTEGQSARPGGV